MTGRRIRCAIFAISLITFLGIAVSNTPSKNPAAFIGENPLYDDNNAYCIGTFEDVDSEFANVTVNWSVSSTEVYGEEFLNVNNNTVVNSTLDSSNYTDNQEVFCNMTVDDMEDDDVVWDTDNLIADTFPPTVSGPNFHNYSSRHAFNVSAVLTDLEGDDEIRQCWMNATDGDGNKIVEKIELRKYYGDSEQARCYFSQINDSLSGFEILEEINVSIWANDSGGDVGNRSKKNPVPNSEPRVFDVRPSNDATISSDSIDLEVRVEDEDGENLDVDFIDQTGSRSTVTKNGVNSGDEVSATWNNLQQLTTYYWRLEVDDGYQTTSERYRFRNQFPEQFRVDTRFESPYTSVLVSPNRSRVVRYSVYNDASSSRNNLVTTTYGADSVISSTSSDSSNSYDLGSGERKFFNVEISPDIQGKHELVVATKSANYNINTSKTMDVYVKDRPANTAEVPGIGLIQLMVLLIFSTLFYSVRL